MLEHWLGTLGFVLEQDTNYRTEFAFDTCPVVRSPCCGQSSSAEPTRNQTRGALVVLSLCKRFFFLVLPIFESFVWRDSIFKIRAFKRKQTEQFRRNVTQ